MKTSVYLEMAKKIIETPTSWCKGELEDDEGRHCAIGAINLACTGSAIYDYEKLVGKQYIIRNKSIHYLTSAVQQGIVPFNDNPRTTHAQVIQAFNTAIAFAKADGE